MTKRLDQIIKAHNKKITQTYEQETSTHHPTKITTNPSNISPPVGGEILEGGIEEGKGEVDKVDYSHAISWLSQKGKELYGLNFQILEEDKHLIKKLICYFLKDAQSANELNINLNKGILLTGPVGCGKTALMSLMRFYEPSKNRMIIKSCRDISFEYIKDGYETVNKYSNRSFKNFDSITYCFDDLGTENNLKFYGNECNIMAEILLSRYDLFISRKLITHLTTNLSASEIETAYGNRVRSRMRELFNLISFENSVKDKRK